MARRSSTFPLGAVRRGLLIVLVGSSASILGCGSGQSGVTQVLETEHGKEVTRNMENFMKSQRASRKAPTHAKKMQTR